MALPASGQISLSQVNTELSIASTTQISFNQTNVRSLAGVASGQIAMSNLHGKSATVPPTVIGTSFNTASNTTMSYPSGTVSGDLVIIHAISYASHPSVEGFSNLTSFSWPSYSYHHYIFYKISAGETGVSVFTNLGNHGAITLRGVHATTPFGAVGSWSGEIDGASISVPGITLTNSKSMCLSCAMDRDPGSFGIPSGFTSQLNTSSTYFANGIASRLYGTTGATGNITWTQINGGFAAVGVMFEVLPA
jgi:hypothetical protein